MNFTRKQLINAIKKIDENPALRKGRESSTYDLIYNEKKYPPILVLSVANQTENGKELYLSDFNDNVKEPFKVLTMNGFEIMDKNSQELVEQVKSFSIHYKKEHNEKHSSNLESYNILVKKLPKIIKNKFSLDDNYKIKGSIGAGNNTNYPWLGIFHKKVSTGATNGFYIVILFSNDFDYIYLTLNQGSTVQEKETIENNRRFIFSIDYKPKDFIKGVLPNGSLVRNADSNSNNKGRQYESTNLYYKEYKIRDLNEESFSQDLKELVKFYSYSVNELNKNSSKVNKEHEKDISSMNKPVRTFKLEAFRENCLASGLMFSNLLINRFTASLLTKPFIICSGLSGSGKTKLAQAFVQWITEDKYQYKIVPVGADWTNREPLLGYPNGLDPKSYVTPDSGVLQLIIDASLEKNKDKPYFLILDEMNLSHVERYFADFLSIMESGDSIKLYSGEVRNDSEGNSIIQEISWPKNLFIIGTVNIDETTYMFSPKVLDRANVIEFRIRTEEMKNFLINRTDLDLNKLFLNENKENGGAGQAMGNSFMKLAKDKAFKNLEEPEKLTEFFNELQKVGAEFGYRSASEIELLITKLGLDIFKNEDNVAYDFKTKMDIAIMQKLLPKLHGSRKKLITPLEILAGFCIERINDSSPADSDKNKNLYLQYLSENKNADNWIIRYPISLEKIERMHKNALENGFTSYAEA
jgi:5-methylcytosine-specific restriction protein B